MSLRVHLKRQIKAPGVDPLGLKRFAKQVLRGEKVTDGAVTMVLTDNVGIRDLNQKFRDLDKVTDVLAFPLNEDDEQGLYLGDVVISLERARDQAPRFNNNTEAELARLVVHGLLHLLGYDHHSPAEGRTMKAAERRALRAFLPGSLWPESDEGRA